ncbi:hypothetical protein G3I59_14225 [Amycolatopsis rubida]|uniref:Uncharacterized protein n=1 Tax=Amycolatopsis rubida TaxID=112413 RepID=A0ABX0BM54_9PSEU|nr:MULTISPECIES: hypothetical protein [Amycolatopsis]MYW91723.1 hypothetical protein [Amycolatopsis rubida]NEC56707.1 hypothetical protein [Amycolatopsis rubida]OAP20396.1 hypothetical protein A4R44_08820 [Amycolatopsis sp. M39]
MFADDEVRQALRPAALATERQQSCCGGQGCDIPTVEREDHEESVRTRKTREDHC